MLRKSTLFQPFHLVAVVFRRKAYLTYFEKESKKSGWAPPLPPLYSHSIDPLLKSREILFYPTWLPLSSIYRTRSSKEVSLSALELAREIAVVG